MFAYKSQKLLRNIFQGIWVNQKGIENVKKLLSSKHHVLLMPSYKSFADLTILL
jgi:hypothetical protein